LTILTCPTCKRGLNGYFVENTVAVDDVLYCRKECVPFPIYQDEGQFFAVQPEALQSSQPVPESTEKT
jgi:hypothetical protein